MSSLGYYTGQMRMARDLAMRELGVEKVACMSDSDIVEWVDGNYAIFYGEMQDEHGNHVSDEETIALIPNAVFNSIRDSIVWIQR